MTPDERSATLKALEAISNHLELLDQKTRNLATVSDFASLRKQVDSIMKLMNMGKWLGGRVSALVMGIAVGVAVALITHFIGR